jgi:dTDP-4-dehydrorhamnose reductase
MQRGDAIQFNAAAYTAVDKAEDDPLLAEAILAAGALGTIAGAAARRLMIR